jgi:hypothetical protein
MERYERGLVGSFPGFGIMTGQGEMVGAHALIEDSCQGKNGNPRRVFEYGGSKFVGPRSLSVFQQLDIGFYLVRKNLDNERVVFRKGAEKIVGGRGCGENS